MRTRRARRPWIMFGAAFAVWATTATAALAAPVALIAQPGASPPGNHFELGEAATVEFVCLDSGEPLPDADCVETSGLRPGDALDTSSLGVRTVEVTATDAGGGTATASVEYHTVLELARGPAVSLTTADGANGSGLTALNPFEVTAYGSAGVTMLYEREAALPPDGDYRFAQWEASVLAPSSSPTAATTVQLAVDESLVLGAPEDAVVYRDRVRVPRCAEFGNPVYSPDPCIEGYGEMAFGGVQVTVATTEPTGAWALAFGPPDVTPPDVQVSIPGAGPPWNTFALDEFAATSFTCEDEESGVVQCTGPGGAASGEQLDTSQLGDRTFEVTAADAAGNTRTVSVPYVVAREVARGPSGSLTTFNGGGGVLTTEDPFEATVGAPRGAVSARLLYEQDATIDPADGVTFVQAAAVVDATSAGPPGRTTTVEIGLDASIVGGPETAARLYRNGVAVPDCTDPGAPEPDPCVGGRTLTQDGDVLVSASTFSPSGVWTIGFASAGPGGDQDGDGVADAIGAGPGGFDDGDGTAGVIVDRDGLDVQVTDAASPEGVRVTVGAGTGSARLSVCGFTLTLAPGSEATITCGSVTVRTEAGQVRVLIDGGVVTIPAGASARITTTPAGSTVDSVAGGTVTVAVGTTTSAVGPGGAVELGARRYLSALAADVRAVGRPVVALTLLAPLALADEAVRRDRPVVACAAMNTFIRLADGYSGRSLTAAQSAQLVAGGTRVRALIGCR